MLHPTQLPQLPETVRKVHLSAEKLKSFLKEELPYLHPFISCCESNQNRKERNENCLLMMVQASIVLGNLGLMQLQLYSCLLTKSKEGHVGKTGQKEGRISNPEQSSCPYHKNNLLSQLYSLWQTSTLVFIYNMPSPAFGKT